MLRPLSPLHLSFSGSILESFHLFVYFLLAEYSCLFNCFPFISIFFQYWPWWCLFQTTWNFLYSSILFSFSLFFFSFLLINLYLSKYISVCLFTFSVFPSWSYFTCTRSPFLSVCLLPPTFFIFRLRENLPFVSIVMDGRLTAKLTAGIFVRCETTFKEEKNIVKFQTFKKMFCQDWNSF